MLEPLLFHYVLHTLPPEYGPFKISYNIHKENWSMNQLLAMYVDEEQRLKLERQESAHLASHKGKRQMDVESGQSIHGFLLRRKA